MPAAAFRRRTRSLATKNAMTTVRKLQKSFDTGEYNHRANIRRLKSERIPQKARGA